MHVLRNIVLFDLLIERILKGVLLLFVIFQFITFVTARNLFWYSYGVVNIVKSMADNEDPIRIAVGECIQKTCTVRDNPGGDIGIFLAAEIWMHFGGYNLTIDGTCNSSCEMLAERFRPHVCVTKRAVFGIHKGFMVIPVPYIDKNQDGIDIGYRFAVLPFRFEPAESSDITKWIEDNGGSPGKIENGMPTMDMLELKFPETLKFWPLCNTNQSATP